MFLQIEKTVLFVLEQEGILASRILQLGEQRKLLLEQPEVSRICDLREAYRAVGHDLLKLLRFIDMNATGIRKILKKFDKQVGFRFTDYYVTTRSNHPYSQLQQVFKHVVISLALIFLLFKWTISSVTYFNFVIFHGHDKIFLLRILWLGGHNSENMHVDFSEVFL